jgi:hypothetical protein
VNVAGTQYLIVLGTFITVYRICEMLWAAAFCERLLNRPEKLGIGWNGCQISMIDHEQPSAQ